MEATHLNIIVMTRVQMSREKLIWKLVLTLNQLSHQQIHMYIINSLWNNYKIIKYTMQIGLPFNKLIFNKYSLDTHLSSVNGYNVILLQNPKQRTYGFDLLTEDDKVFYPLAAESQREMEEWITVLGKAIGMDSEDEPGTLN